MVQIHPGAPITISMKKIIVISGGSDGLGKEIARVLSYDHTVICIASDEEKLKAVSHELRCDYFVCDISNSDQILSTAQKILKKYSQIDCLINNAGQWIEGKLAENDIEQIKKVFTVNSIGTILLTKAIIPAMQKQKDGLIVNIISQAGLYAKAERAVYTASKWALTGFTKSLQSELSADGIRVTGVYPGKMKTMMFEKVGIHKDMKDGLDPAQAAQAISYLISLPPSIVIPEIGIKNINN